MYAMVMAPPSAAMAPTIDRRAAHAASAAEPTGPVEVALHRAPDQLWGFRLQGGADYRTQLTVMRIEQSSPAYGKLHTGDAIQSVNGKKSRQLSHAEASAIIKESGNSLLLTVIRQRSAADCLDHIRPAGKPKFSRPGS